MTDRASPAGGIPNLPVCPPICYPQQVVRMEELPVYAIVQARGRQMKVTPGAVIEVDGAPAEAGSPFTFEQVLLVEKDAGDIVAGAPYVAGAKVVGVVDGEARGPKIRVFKKKRRKGFRKTRGHRSVFTRVRITEIVA